MGLHPRANLLLIVFLPSVWVGQTDRFLFFSNSSHVLHSDDVAPWGRHVMVDADSSTGTRFCINSASVKFVHFEGAAVVKDV